MRSSSIHDARTLRSVRKLSVLLALVVVQIFSSACANAQLEEKLAALEKEKTACAQQQAELRKDKDRLTQELRLAQGKVAQLEAAQKAQSSSSAENTLGLKPGQKLYATIETSMGNMVAELYWDKAPRTVENFVALAEGKKEWLDPKTSERIKKPLYSGTLFHRVIPGFMIQGGDPLGTGTGGPGYKFEDEFSPDLKHDGPGILSMANSGPNTNGSQFFITEKATPWLDNRHTIFGRIIDNVDLVGRIARVPRGPNDKPNVDVIIKGIKISKTKGAANSDADKDADKDADANKDDKKDTGDKKDKKKKGK